MNTLFNYGFPKEWSTIKKLIWLYAILQKQKKQDEENSKMEDENGKQN